MGPLSAGLDVGKFRGVSRRHAPRSCAAPGMGHGLAALPHVNPLAPAPVEHPCLYDLTHLLWPRRRYLHCPCAL